MVRERKCNIHFCLNLNFQCLLLDFYLVIFIPEMNSQVNENEKTVKFPNTTNDKQMKQDCKHTELSALDNDPASFDSDELNVAKLRRV